MLAGTATDMRSGGGDERRQGGREGDAAVARGQSRKAVQTYVWKRGVLAGTERTDPLDVIAREREKLEEELAAAAAAAGMEGVDGAEEAAAVAQRRGNAGTTRDGARRVDVGKSFDEGGPGAGGVNVKRRAIPPPPGRAVDAEDEQPGGGSKVLLGLTLFLYLVSLFLTTSRAYLGDGVPAPAPGAEASVEVPPPPVGMGGGVDCAAVGYSLCGSCV